ncbi:MAG: GH3 auxin-responsive promoter family protein [Rhodospirillales bacterium]|nr:GH3 auxin-responsive promoter family protein [Rhodospirillales bacterium]
MIGPTSLLKFFSRRRLRRLAGEDSAAVQQRALLALLRRAAETRFGQDHGFAAIDSVETFQAKVPLRRFEDFWNGYWKQDFPLLTGASWPGQIPFFAKTSGTTSGTSKYIPVTEGILDGNRRAILDLMAFHLAAKPDSRVLGGHTFMLGGSTSLEALAPGVSAGDMSGISALGVPRWAKLFYYPSLEIAQIPDWERKMSILAEDSPKRDIRMIGGTTSWLLLFLENLAAAKPGGLAKVYPNLEMIVYGGVGFKPYHSQFEQLLKGMTADLREVYPASEGFLAVADRGVGEGLRLQCDGGLFFEFVPVEDLDKSNPRRHWLATAEIGVNYALVLSNPAGAFAYILGDTLRFVSLAPPRILITGRTATALSAFGEHLIEDEIQTAVAEAADALSLAVQDFSVGPVFPHAGEPRGHHIYVVEFEGGQPEQVTTDAFAHALDRALCRLNDDYRDHRSGDLQMKSPEVLAAPPGHFFTWMKERGKLGGQNKVPRVINDPALLDSLVASFRRVVH